MNRRHFAGTARYSGNIGDHHKTTGMSAKTHPFITPWPSIIYTAENCSGPAARPLLGLVDIFRDKSTRCNRFL